MRKRPKLLSTTTSETTAVPGPFSSRMRKWLPARLATASRPFQSRHCEPSRNVAPEVAIVDGPLVFERKVELYVHSSAKTGPVTGATPVRFDGATPPGQ